MAARRPPRRDRWPDPAPDLPARDAARDAAREGVHWALARLTPPQRACLLPRARAGLTIDELAWALALSPVAARRTLRRAKERCRAADASDEEA